MSVPFTHPLARQAQVWKTEGVTGKEGKILVVVTTLELDPKQKGYKADKFKRLSDAAREWVSHNPDEAGDVLVISKPKTWAGERH